MARKTLLTLTAAVLTTANLLATPVTQYLKVSVTENSNVTIQQSFSLIYAFSVNGSDGLDADDIGNQNSIGNPGNDVYPFSVSSNGDIITQQDSRPDLIGYKRFQFGFISKFPSTIKVLASAFGNSADTTNRPTYAWIEQISTGYIYPFFGDTVKIDIPANEDYVADFYLHTGPYIKTGKTDETCFASYNGDVSVINPNCNSWKLDIFINSVFLSSDSVFQSDTTIANLTAGTYTLITSVNSIPVDSSVLIITSEAQIIADFTTDNYTPTTNDVVNFTNMSTVPMGPISYSWTFGDGDTDTQSSTSHQYANAGAYEIVLTVTSSIGCQATVFDSVWVTSGAPLMSHFSGSPQLINYNNVPLDSILSKPYVPFDIYSMEAQRIMITQSENQFMSVTIMNVSGQIISTTETAEAKIELEVPATGIYIVRVINAKREMQSKTIMVTN